MKRSWKQESADLAVSALPSVAVKSLIAAAALAPRMLKTPSFERIYSALARRSGIDGEVLALTNLGISSCLRCEIPLAKSHHVFGRPENVLSERATLALVGELCCDCAEFVDVGANEGIFLFLVSQKYVQGVRLHWFEPDLDLYKRLAKNLKTNLVESFGNRIAITDKKGRATFFKNLSDDSSGSLTGYFVDKHETRVEKVDSGTLSDYFEEYAIRDALVKIDVEGSGYQAWLGASRAVSAMRYLVMEMLAPEIRNDVPAKIIADAGLCGYYVRDFDLVASYDGTFDYVPPFWNWLFCRLPPTQLKSRLARTRFRVIE